MHKCRIYFVTLPVKKLKTMQTDLIKLNTDTTRLGRNFYKWWRPVCNLLMNEKSIVAEQIQIVAEQIQNVAEQIQNVAEQLKYCC